MMKSRLSGEMEREGSHGSLSMTTPRDVTPTPPLRPLKWKSLTEEEDTEQEKTQGLSGLRMTDAKNALQDGVVSDAMVVMTGREEEEEDGEIAAKLQQHVQPSAVSLGLADQTKHVDDLSLKGRSGTEQVSVGDSPGGHERKPSSGEEAMTMTIEFLRARLLAERAASKAAKQQVQQLNKQMIELERKLEQTVDERKKAERAAEKAMAELESAGPCTESATEASGTSAGHSFVVVDDDGTRGRAAAAAAAPQAQEPVVQPEPDVLMSAEEEKKLKQDGTGDEKESIKVDVTQDNTNVANDSTLTNPHASAANGCIMTNAVVLDTWPPPQNTLERSNWLIQSQESRVAIVDRLRKTWSQISEEMNALAEERSEEDQVCAELVSWMCQVSAVLQEILPTTTGPPGHQSAQGTNENGHIVGTNENGCIVGLTIESAHEENAEMDVEGKEGTTVLREEFEAQESAQKEWEKNYYDSQQTLEQNSRDLQREEASDIGRRMGTHPSHLESGVLVSQGDGRPHEGLVTRSSDDAYERAQQERGVMTAAAEKDALEESLSRGQQQALAETGIVRHLQAGHDEANLLSAQIMLYGQKEGTASLCVMGHGNNVAEEQYRPHSKRLGESMDWNSRFSNGELQLSLGYGPGYDTPPKEASALVEQPSMDSTSRNASDILQALQRLKLNIQGSSLSEKNPNIGSRGDPSLLSRAERERRSPPVKYLQQASAPAVHERLTHNRQRQLVYP